MACTFARSRSFDPGGGAGGAAPSACLNSAKSFNFCSRERRVGGSSLASLIALEKRCDTRRVRAERYGGDAVLASALNFNAVRSRRTSSIGTAAFLSAAVCAGVPKTLLIGGSIELYRRQKRIHHPRIERKLKEDQVRVRTWLQSPLFNRLYRPSATFH